MARGGPGHYDASAVSDFDAIVKSLKSPLEAERERAIQALVRTRDVRSVAILQKVASADESVAVRYMAKKGLFYLRKQLGLGELAPEAASSSGESGVARKAELPQEKLRSILQGDDDGQKLKLLQALTRRKLHSALPLLLAHDISAESPEVRSNMVLVVGILGGEEELKFLRTFLDDPDPRVRANTIEAMEYLGSPRMYPLVVKALADPDNRIRTNAIKALRTYGKVNCLALLEKMVESPKVWMRDSAAYALGLIGEGENVRPLARLLDDGEPSVREKARGALEALAQRGVPGAAEALQAASPPSQDTGIDSLFDVPPEAAEVLFGRASPDADEEAAEDDPLRSPDAKTRIRGVEEIIETHDRDRLDDLLAAAREEEDGFVRAKMVIGLGRLADKAYLERLLPFLDDEVDRVRANAVEALALCDRDLSQPYLVPLLADSNNRVRANAVIALKSYPEVDVIETLREMATSPEPLVRRSAFYAITDIATPEAHALIRQMIDDEQEEMRKKVQDYVEMCADDGDQWARELRSQRQAIRGEDLAGEGFAAFEPTEETGTVGPKPDRGKSAMEARERLQRFRGLGMEGKRGMIAAARDDVCLESYFFLRELLEEEDFEIKVQAKMALRAFDDDMFHEAAMEGSTDLAALLKPPEIRPLEYHGFKQSTELNKELNQRTSVAEQRGYWEGGPFPEEFVLLNALREDTREMIVEELGGEDLTGVYLCYFQDRMEPFRIGKKTLDSNRYANLVNLQNEVNRAPSDTFHGTLMHSQKRPAYLLALTTDERLILFLRGSVQTTVASVVSVHWAVMDRAEATRVGAGTSVSIEALGTLVELPEMRGDDARRIYERAREREDSRMKGQYQAMSTTREFRRIDLLLQGGVISEEEYQKRKALLERAKE